MPKGRLVFDGDNIYTEKDARIYKLKTSVSSKIDAIPWVVDSLDSVSTTDALSANMGRQLQDQINSLSWTWKFLSTWNAVTWLPGTNPQEDPYTYKVGDYYVVSTTGSTNYKPHWGTYTQWVPSTTVETENVWTNDKYYFDGADWVRIPDTAIQIWIDSALSTTSTNAVENRAIANAINTKQNIIPDLNDIRSWATAWATALQALDNITELTNNAWYQTAWDVTTIVNNAISQLAPSWVNNWTLTIQKNSAPVWTFTANQSSNSTVNITVPTTVAELSDASDYATKADVAWDLADYVKASDLWAAALSNDYDDLNNKPTIPTVNNATLTIQKNSTNVATFTANASSNVTANISVPTTVAELSDASSYATKADLNSKIITAAIEPQNKTEWMLWYDTVFDKLRVRDWTQWVEVGKEYTAWEGISIWNISYNARRWPCPEWFHVPSQNEWIWVYNIMAMIWEIDSSLWSMILHMPLAWYREYLDGGVNLQWSSGYYWSSAPESSNTSFMLFLNPPYAANTSAYTSRADWCSIRPFKDTFVPPTTADWQYIIKEWDTWVYINLTEWLISVTSDLITGYTMMDRNLWATNIYSSWDTLSEANCWYYYQRWNNYWFTYSWSVTTSSTPVSTVWYWPTNPYSNSTFIIWNIDWSGAANDDLWWDTTWIVTLHNAISSIQLSDAAFSSSWDGDTTHAPSKNAIYDVLWDVETLLANL